MSKYRITGPVSYVQKGKAVLHTRPADVYEIDDAVAGKLGDKVERIGTDEKTDEKPAASKQSGK